MGSGPFSSEQGLEDFHLGLALQLSDEDSSPMVDTLHGEYNLDNKQYRSPESRRIRGKGMPPYEDRTYSPSMNPLFKEDFLARGKIVLADEPETAWSIWNQILKFRKLLARIEREDSQAIIATHSPLILATALDMEGTVFNFTSNGVTPIPLQEMNIEISPEVVKNLKRLFRE